MNFELYVDNELHYIYKYSSKYITKKEPKPDNRLSKFGLSPIFLAIIKAIRATLAIILLHNLKVF